jgi:CBS domain containing-hemolysin-like protein
MILEWMSDPAAWAGLATLVVLEIVLGIDNLVFIAILAEKLPPHQRNKARLIGLSLALIMRLGLLASIAWIVTLTQPLFEVFGYPFSGRDLILIFGGVFLLFKGTMELHERLEGRQAPKEANVVHAAFWVVIAQIVVLDAVFSLDSVITAVGMVKHLSIMMIAVVIAIAVMMIASRPLMNFVSKHPTVVVLCLGFLMMIGFSLIIEGFGFHIPKGYLYAAIGFSVLVEAFNQTARRNRERSITTSDLRERAADAVLRLLGGKHAAAEPVALGETADVLVKESLANEVFSPEEKGMIHGVLTLAERPVKSIMTPRPDIEWVDLDDDDESIRQQIMSMSHSRLLLARGNLDNFEGIALNHTVLSSFFEKGSLSFDEALRQPLIVHENIKVLSLMEQLRQAPLQMAVILNEYGSIEGIATPIDILEAIAGEFPDEDHDENGEIQLEDGSWLVDGSSDIRRISLLCDRDLVDEADQYSTLTGYLLLHLGHLPEIGAILQSDKLIFEVISMDGRKIDKVKITPEANEMDQVAE